MLEGGLEFLKAWDEAVLRKRYRSDKTNARVLLPDHLTGEETTHLLYVCDSYLLFARKRKVVGVVTAYERAVRDSDENTVHYIPLANR